jgi:hypothetical protein
MSTTTATPRPAVPPDVPAPAAGYHWQMADGWLTVSRGQRMLAGLRPHGAPGTGWDWVVFRRGQRQPTAGSEPDLASAVARVWRVIRAASWSF